MKSIVLFGIWLAVGGLPGFDGDAAEPDPPPNVVLMMADDMGMGDTSAYQDLTGNADDVQIATPQMDRLARLGVRFSDAHTPSSRCSPTRYALLTGRYPWRNRLKHWVLFGAQGDPMIEADRPTLATLMGSAGYRTGLVGKWHVGLRYRTSDGRPAAGWDDADLKQPLFDTPIDHGFDFARFTSRSHGTSGPSAGNRKRPNGIRQKVGPGHIDGRTAVGATGEGKRLVSEGSGQYVLERLGSRHSDHAIEFMSQHVGEGSHSSKPFFLYYASNSNHSPYTPDEMIGGVPVAGAGRNVEGDPIDIRADYVYENDVALGRLIDFLSEHEDPRRPGHSLLDNTIVIFTSDNGAERDTREATGPFRSHKGSAYEGGHRVPFLVAWKAGAVGDGEATTPGETNATPISLQDVYATLAEVVDQPLPDLRAGEKGAEDSVSLLATWRGGTLDSRPLFFHDHSQAKDHAAGAIRIDDPIVSGMPAKGQWKLFFDAGLLRQGVVHPVELFELSSDPEERNDRLGDSSLRPLVAELTRLARLHRNSAGHRYVPLVSEQRITFVWTAEQRQRSASPGTQVVRLAAQFGEASTEGVEVRCEDQAAGLTMTVTADLRRRPSDTTFHVNARGLGVGGGRFDQVDQGEAIVIRFDRDVLVESAAVVAGNGKCGGFYQLGKDSPLAIYCVDADIDAQDQSGILSDIGLLRAGESLRLDSRPHFGVESPGQWRLAELTVRLLETRSLE